MADMLLQFSEGLLKTLPTGEHCTSSDDVDDSHTVLFDNISTPSATVGAAAAKTGARYSLGDLSLTNLRTELRNVLAGLKNRQFSKGLSYVFYIFFIMGTLPVETVAVPVCECGVCIYRALRCWLGDRKGIELSKV